jgi:GT2 family glycosyltransferase
MTEATGELLIACDGGPEHLREAVGPLLDSHGWTSRWFQLPAGGPARARNAVIPHARGELILFLNDDIRAEPGLLRAHDQAHRARPGHAVMGNTRWAPEVIDSEFMHWVAHHDSFYYLIPRPERATWEYFHTMNLSIDRLWFTEKAARFDETYPDPAFEDTDLGYQLCRQGLQITLAYDAILYHVHHFRFEEYLAKSRMRGRSARRFVEKFPELGDRILSEYQWQAKRISGPVGIARVLAGRLDPLEEMESRIAREFLRGYN